MARLLISRELLAQVLEEHWPWPEGTSIHAPDDDYEDIAPVSLEVQSPSCATETEVVPVFRRADDGTISFVSWNP